MVWTQIIVIDESAYPLNVAQKTAYALAATVSILITRQDGNLHLTVTPADLRIDAPHLSEAQASVLITRSLNDFALRQQIQLETSGLRELLAGVALREAGI
ncbi:His-Xaa-Ser system protein HxsD [Pseudomonas sp. PDM11]|uniref:His-Xaa-Ser system protein HxsD n=1 Tax=Pseudomonas sp. PDM11 TaxID=2769309 RepID=UPI001780433B|nr:His-Xaa-Ser system protein HxsD [Pseudomonas sp. PDM11]MBD9397954.1 His-Xaa-Ser system protein HxsD [Pseudomonas sp. PDM11]